MVIIPLRFGCRVPVSIRPTQNIASTGEAMASTITTFAFKPGRKIGSRYVIERLLGSGTEGEVYQIRERDTDIYRAAKIYFTNGPKTRKLAVCQARRLEDLRHCPIVLQYHHCETITVNHQTAVALISEFCDGEPLNKWLAHQRGGRLTPYEALHVLYHLVTGLESIHALNHYHADVHSENILIKPHGINFDLKLVDFYEWGKPTSAKKRQDIFDTINIFHECLGGRRHYAKLPAEIKHICAGLKYSILADRFPTMTKLRQHLENFEWSAM